MMYGYGIGMYVVGFFGIAIMIGMILLIVWVIKYGPNSGSGTEKKDQPIAILKKRLAQGEINEEEYDRLKRKLEE